MLFLSLCLCTYAHFLLLLLLLLLVLCRLCDDITWVKTTVNRRMAKGHGFYLQHAKETCLVGRKGRDPPGLGGARCSDVVFAERRGQSQKPEQLYELIETLVPNGEQCTHNTHNSNAEAAVYTDTSTHTHTHKQTNSTALQHSILFTHSVTPAHAIERCKTVFTLLNDASLLLNLHGTNENS